MGSNPIARSSFSKLASWPSGKARVCKTLITGSNPVDASQASATLAFLFAYEAPVPPGALPPPATADCLATPYQSPLTPSFTPLLA